MSAESETLFLEIISAMVGGPKSSEPLFKKLYQDVAESGSNAVQGLVTLVSAAAAMKKIARESLELVLPKEVIDTYFDSFLKEVIDTVFYERN
jgi:hypothetical protein